MEYSKSLPISSFSPSPQFYTLHENESAPGAISEYADEPGKEVKIYQRRPTYIDRNDEKLRRFVNDRMMRLEGKNEL